jgi:archaellum component FlaF (FlaF/FlaG flagellin family)
MHFQLELTLTDLNRTLAWEMDRLVAEKTQHLVSSSKNSQNTNLVENTIIPGRLSLITRMIHFTCFSHAIDNRTMRYVMRHSKLRWVRTTARNASTVAGAIYTMPQLMIARNNMTILVNGTNVTYQQVGKVTTNSLYSYFAPPTGAEIRLNAGDPVDVLACAP